MVSLVSRTGRDLQRYNKGNNRLVVGCVPYRYKNGKHPSNGDIVDINELEVLMISSQNGNGMLFPKGGWEIDESKKEAALRESFEEAGVVGDVEFELGQWSFMSKRYGTMYEGYMFSLHVKEEHDDWPEKNFRERKWLSVREAGDVCHRVWMKDALDKLVDHLMTKSSQQLDMATCAIC